MYLNEIKYARVLRELKQRGIEVTKEVVDELYLKYGGVIVDDEETEEGQDEQSDAPRRGRPRKV